MRKAPHARILVLVMIFFAVRTALSNPYPDPNKVPKLPSAILDRYRDQKPVLKMDLGTREAIRITVGVQTDPSTKDVWRISEMVLENSGTDALAQRTKTKPEWGSFLGILEFLSETAQGKRRVQRFDSVGTGHLFKFLNRELSFRYLAEDFTGAGANPRLKFRLIAENSKTGVMQEVFQKEFSYSDLSQSTLSGEVEVRELKKADTSHALQLVIYSEGYLAGEKDLFFQHANRVPNVFEQFKFPDLNRVRILAAFFPSARSLGSAQALAMPVPKFNTWLGLYFPYWMNFGRWYHVTYPTRENDFRHSLASVPYDYPIALTNSSNYWGVGNYKSHTAIPAKSTSFGYLLMHEFGHFMGLNEEYDGGGRTELEFAPLIQEPWSQNLTFLREPAKLKWRNFVANSTPVPTPSSQWNSLRPLYGAYSGGYGDSEPIKQSYIPGLSCVMEAGKDFCPICQHALHEMITHDLGETH